ncbi:SulP family inorganic anion transporter [Legionella sp. km772]|uniref:SulP family inorganic anion transporter n=1 Tax=Legionella sp. km772 TaxID=2498111 RepID=UPI000F8E4F67|nr:sulfate permease [Legionella sp. km772]RUR11933.1 sulfate permease [Legionella sp. km772]
MNAFIESYRAGLFQKAAWLPNIISGIIVGVVALPLAMAFAIASGAKPEQGLYTAIIAGFLVSLFGGSRLQIAGPTGAFVVILSGITAKYGISGLQIATLMAGLILLLFGLARLGGIIKFIPIPVIVGFTAGIGLVIWIGQWSYFFGLPETSGGHFHERLWHLVQALPHLNLPTTLLGLASLLVVLFINKVPGFKKIPGPLVALVFATIFQAFYHSAEIATIGSLFGGIPQGLPHFSLPALSIDRIIELIAPAFTIAMLGAIESLLSAVVADGMAGTRHDSNQELIGQGIANIVTPFFGGFAATGAIARTATNIRNGGTSPLSGMIHSLTLVLIILFLAPLAIYVPLTTLAAILFVVAWNMSEVKHFLKIIRVAPKADVIVLLVTFVLTVFVDLVIAVNIGVIIAVLHFLRRMASSVAVQQMTEQQIIQEVQENKAFVLPRGLAVYTIEGPFFFAAVEVFQHALAITHTDPKVLILRFRWVPFIDLSGLQSLEEVIKDLHQRAVQVMLCETNALVEGKMRKAGIVSLIGETNFHKEFSLALRRADIDVFHSHNQTISVE